MGPSWQKNLEHHCKIPNYDCFFYNRQGQLAGGIAIYVKQGKNTSSGKT